MNWYFFLGNNFALFIFSSPVQMYCNSYCTTPSIGIGGGSSISSSKMLKFYVTVFYMVGKALSGELSCTQTYLMLPSSLRANFQRKEFASRVVNSLVSKLTLFWKSYVIQENQQEVTGVFPFCENGIYRKNSKYWDTQTSYRSCP